MAGNIRGNTRNGHQRGTTDWFRFCPGHVRGQDTAAQVRAIGLLGRLEHLQEPQQILAC